MKMQNNTLQDFRQTLGNFNDCAVVEIYMSLAHEAETIKSEILAGEHTLALVEDLRATRDMLAAVEAKIRH